MANESIELRRDDATDAIDPLLLPAELLAPLPSRRLPARLLERLARNEFARLLGLPRRPTDSAEASREAIPHNARANRTLRAPPSAATAVERACVQSQAATERWAALACASLITTKSQLLPLRSQTANAPP